MYNIDKRGGAPFHFWLPQVISKINWNNNLILMTIQKLAPIVIISYLINDIFISFIIILNIIFRTIRGFNQLSIRKIIAFSSINHIGWIFLALIVNETLWINYYLFYCFFSITIVYFIKTYNLFFINQGFSLKINFLRKFAIFCSFLSLGGLPPFLGFFPKWLTIQFAVNFNFLLILIIVLSSLIVLYFYLRICYSAFFLFNNFNSWKYLNFKIKKMGIFNLFIILRGLFIISFLFIFF